MKHNSTYPKHLLWRLSFRINIPSDVMTCFYMLFTKFLLQEWRSLWIQPISHVYRSRLRSNRRNIQNTLAQNLSLTLFTNRVIIHLNYLIFLYIKGKNRIVLSIEFDILFYNCIIKTKQHNIWGKLIIIPCKYYLCR